MNNVWQRINYELVQLKINGLQKVEEMVMNVIEIQLNESIDCQDAPADDEFQLYELMQKNEDAMYFFAKLIMAKIQNTLPVFLEKFQKIVKQYEEVAQILIMQMNFQNSSLALSQKRSIELQLTYLLKIINQILPQGMPSCHGKLQ